MKRISLRFATPDDWPRIQELHREQQAKQGTNFELPYIFGRQFPVVLAACDDAGTIHGCIYVEAVAEMRFIGCDPKATAFGRRSIQGLSYVLKNMGFRFLECYVPQQLKRAISKPLKRAGFVDKAEELAYFSRDLRG